MARSRRKRASASSLDSLLDTMANVVGILIVLVAVTQLSVGDAVERIRSESGERAAANPDDLAQVVGEQEVLDDEVASVRSKLEAYSVQEREGMLFADAQDLLLEFESLPGESDAAGDQPSEAEIKARRERLDNLKGEVAESRGEHEQLLAILKEPARGSTPRVIRLPDPRPPPPGMDRRFVFCRYGQVFVIDLKALEAVLLAGVADAVGSPSEGVTVVLKEGDERWVNNHFEKQWIGHDGFRWVFQPDRREPFVVALTFTDRVKPGESEAALLAGGSKLEKALDTMNTRREYIRFFVWPDSYDVYLAARQLAEEQRFRVGWDEQKANGKLIFTLLESARPVRRTLD